MKTFNTNAAKEMSEKRSFDYEVEISFKSGEKRILHNVDLMTNGCEITQSGESSTFPIGVAYGKRLTLVLNNIDDRWSEYDFYGAEIRVFIVYQLSDGTAETLYMGDYFVTEPETYGSTIDTTAIDYMCLTDKLYVPSITSGTLLEVAEDVLGQCNLSLSDTNFVNNSFVVTHIPTDKTCRNVLGMIAMLAGGFATIDDSQGKRNKVKINTYNMEVLPEVYDGGTFDNYGNLPILDGGDFTFSDTDIISGGTFADQKQYHVLFRAPKVTVCTDDVQITGVSSGDICYPNTDNSYILSINNDLISDNLEAGLQLIYSTICDLRFRPFEMDHVSYPLADIGDCAYVIDRKSRVYNSIITDIAFNFKGSTTIKCTADSPLRTGKNYDTASTRAIQNSADIKRNYDEMSEEIRNASGSYTTIVPANALGEISNALIVDVFDPDTANVAYSYYEPTATVGNYTVYTFDGTQWNTTLAQDISRIVYNHNKRLLMDSDVQWRETATTRSVSTDFGKTWNLAIDASGTVIAERLNAQTIIGLNIQNAETNPTFKVDGSGNITGANITGSKFSNKDGTFQAFENGGMKATQGDIGNFKITNGYLFSNSGGRSDRGVWVYPAGGYSGVFGTLTYGGVVVGIAGSGLYCMGYIYEGKPRLARATGSGDVQVLTHNDIWFKP